MEIVYARSLTGMEQGRVFRNARLFDGRAEPGATKVFVSGDWPKIVAAYKMAGVEVEEIGDAPARGIGAERPPVAPEIVPEQVEIPSDWRFMSWQDKRALAAKLSNVPVINSAQVRAVIEAEIERRGGRKG